MIEQNRKNLEIALDRLLNGIAQFGSALGAMDHGGPVAELEASGHEIIRSAFERAPELNELIPWLAAKLRAGISVADDGFDIRADVERIRRQMCDQPKES